MEKKKGGGEGGAFKMIIYLASTTKELVFVVVFCLFACFCSGSLQEYLQVFLGDGFKEFLLIAAGGKRIGM